MQAEEKCFKSKLSLVMQQDYDAKVLLSIEQVSIIHDESMIPQEIVLQLNYPEIQELCRLLLQEQSISGLRIMVSGFSDAQGGYNLDNFVSGKLIFTPEHLIFEPLQEYGEKTPLIMAYNQQDLMLVSEASVSKLTAVYCIDVSDSVVLSKFIELLSEKCIHNNQIQLPEMVGVLDILKNLREQLDEKITQVL